MIYIKLVLVAVFWGGTFIATKQVGLELTPLAGAFWRFFIASILLLGIIFKSEGGLPNLTLKQFLALTLSACIGIALYNYAFFKGLAVVEASRAAAIIACTPIVIALCSSVLFKESLTPKKLLGIAISITGAMLVVSRGDLTELLAAGISAGEVYILIAVASWTVYSLLGKVLLRGIKPVVAIGYSCFLGTVILFILSGVEGSIFTPQDYSFHVWLSLFYLAVFGTVLGFVWYYDGIHAVGASKAGLFINLVPVSGVTLAYFILSEPITTSLLFGTALVISGVVLVSMQKG